MSVTDRFNDYFTVTLVLSFVVVVVAAAAAASSSLVVAVVIGIVAVIVIVVVTDGEIVFGSGQTHWLVLFKCSNYLV